MKWYAWRMDEGIVGEYDSKHEAMVMQGASRCRHIEHGCYETIPDVDDGEKSHRVVLGTRKTLTALGVEVYTINVNYALEPVKGYK